MRWCVINWYLRLIPDLAHGLLSDVVRVDELGDPQLLACTERTAVGVI